MNPCQHDLNDDYDDDDDDCRNGVDVNDDSCHVFSHNNGMIDMQLHRTYHCKLAKAALTFSIVGKNVFWASWSWMLAKSASKLSCVALAMKLKRNMAL
eukprot:1442007-Lingulodinium_polyedra.AAC.1